MAKTEQTTFQKFLGLAVAAVIVIVAIVMCTGSKDDPTPSSSTTSKTPTTTTTSQEDEPRDIDASVAFDGTQFTIRNRESRDWVNVRFAINPGFISAGYTLKVQRVEGNTTYTVGAMQFTNSSGERFNPFTHKPESFTIADYSDPWPDQYHLEGFSSYGWE